jgi:transposase InsO family protein
MCEVLGVSRAGYYAWVARPPSRREARHAELLVKVRESHVGSDELYGSPRVTRDLRAAGTLVTEKTVAKLMRLNDIRSVVARKFRVMTTDSDHPNPVADNVLDRDFTADLPNKKWCADITYIPTDEGVLYLAGVIDLCSRRIVGWSMAEHMRASLCTGALEMAVLHRRPGEGLVCHSDRGVQYACDEYRERLDGHGMVCSMSRRGNCYDNAVMESFWGTLKRELLYQQPRGRFASHEEARGKIFKYIEVFYNRRRRHSSIGYESPESFEAGLN